MDAYGINFIKITVLIICITSTLAGPLSGSPLPELKDKATPVNNGDQDKHAVDKETHDMKGGYDPKSLPFVIIAGIVGGVLGLSAMGFSIYMVYSRRRQNPDGFNFFPQLPNERRYRTQVPARLQVQGLHVGHVKKGRDAAEGRSDELERELLPV